MAGEIVSKNQQERLFAPKREPHVVDVPEFRELMVDGAGVLYRTRGRSNQERIPSVSGPLAGT